MKVLVLAQQHEVQADALCPRAERDGADHTDSIAFVRTFQDRCFAARSHGASDHGSQHETRFVQQGDTRVPLVGLSNDARPIIGYPAFHLLQIAFASAFLWLLACPVKALCEQSIDMGGVVINAEVTFDQHPYPFTRPQMVGPTVSDSAFLQQGFQNMQLVNRQARLGARSWFGKQSVRQARHASPTTKGGRCNAKNARHDAWRLSSIDQRNSPTSAPFQLRSFPFWPHTCIIVRTVSGRSFPAQGSVTTSSLFICKRIQRHSPRLSRRMKATGSSRGLSTFIVKSI